MKTMTKLLKWQQKTMNKLAKKMDEEEWVEQVIAPVL
jgi:hypothetical protein